MYPPALLGMECLQALYVSLASLGIKCIKLSYKQISGDKEDFMTYLIHAPF